MSGAAAGQERAPALRAQLAAAGSLLGAPLLVTDDPEWSVDEDGLRVGLGWYTARGHDETEAVALALLLLWETVRSAHAAPDRALRHRTLAEVMPSAVPLLAVIRRLQAAAELLVALPAFRGPLVTALRRLEPADHEELPSHLQWPVLLLRHGIGAEHGSAHAWNAEVQREWCGLGAQYADLGPEEALRRVLAPDPSCGPLQRLERALALLLPPYERLLELDLRARGAAAAGSGAQPLEGERIGDELAGGGAGDDPDAAEHDRERDAAGELAPAGDETEAARAGDGREGAEGADLFEAEHAAFVSTVLSTPMPSDGVLFEAVIDAVVPPGADRDPSRKAVGAGGAAAAEATELADYRARSAALTAPIERMRELWSRVITERIGTKPRLSRHVQPDGDELATEQLAPALAEALAGVERPSAYLRRDRARRRTRRAGSTDYALLIDRSSSMRGRAAESAANAVLIMLEALAGVDRDIAHAEARTGVPLELDIRTALIVFDSEAHVVKPLSSGLDDRVRRELHAAIRDPRGATNDAAALAAAAAQLGIPDARAGDGLERRRIAIVIGDGGTNDPYAAAHELRRLRAAGVRVHGIGLGTDEIVERYAPLGVRLDDPRGISDVLHGLVEDELP
ncbi:MAG: VWA domain-containing protein [Leucobacter sp.]|nr:VWA domain-containing protein [Leucobacter sp.]